MLRFTSLFFGVLTFASSLAFAQTGSCTLRGEPLDSVLDATPNPRGAVACLDLSEIDGKTIRVPENVTKIDAKGLALCSTGTAQTVSLPPAIVFILDQSTSMENNGGDPNHQRAEVVRNAIQRFRETSPNGYFSYIEFAEDIEIPLDHSPNVNNVYYLNTGADSLISVDFMRLTAANVNLWASDSSPIQRRAHSGTNYVSPLRRAKEYINALRADTNIQIGGISVVFLSDGQPYSPNNGDLDTILSVLDSNYEVPGEYVPIHGIFMGQNGTALQSISQATGGTYSAVDPTDPDALGALMDSLVTELALSGTPSSMVMSVDGIDYVSRAMTEDTTGGFQVRLNRSVPLDSGMNTISMDVEFILENGETVTQAVTFRIDVTDTPSDSNYFDAGGYFVGFCNDSNTLAIEGIGTEGYPNTLDPDTTEALEIIFTPAWFSDSTTTITIDVVGTGDREILTIPANLDSTGLASYIASLDLEITDGSRNRRDTVLQTLGVDTVWLRWENPDDETDTLRWMVLIGNTQQLHASNYQISVWETDSVGTRLKALADHLPGEIHPTSEVPPEDLAGRNILLRTLFAGRGPDMLMYTIISGDTSYFTLRGDTLTLARALDFETDSTKSILYTVSDGTLIDTGSVQISILDVNEFPYGRTLILTRDSGISMNEFLLELNALDPEGDSNVFRVLNSEDGDFRLIGDSLVSDNDIPFENGAILRVPVEVRDGSRVDTMWVEIHMMRDPGPQEDNYIRAAEYEDGLLTVISGPGPMQIHSTNGDLVLKTKLGSDGRYTTSIDLDPGIYIITIGCAKRTLVVTGQ